MLTALVPSLPGAPDLELWEPGREQQGVCSENRPQTHPPAA